MPIRISVIVAVYNTGEYIEPLIDTLTRQTLAADEYEIILVDDGSTDDWTIRRLDRLAAERPNVIVRHEPNSGWPGRPRNVGMDVARGKYVFFADHDDWFGLEALERMVEYADACGSDVLIPRYAGHHRGVAKALFDKSRPAVTLESSPLMDSLTPHKLFRLEFLRAEGLRFPEGKRRLEDHVFVVDAYFRAKTISVLADYHCYFHVGRPDAGNAAYNRIDPPSYYGYVREVIEIIYGHTEPGALRDRCLRRPLRQELLGRLDGAGLLTRPREHTRSVFDEARAIALEKLPEDLDAGLAPPQRVRAALLRAGRLDDLLAYVGHQAAIRGRARLTDLAWDGSGRLVLSVDGALYDGAPERPVTYRRDGDALYLTEPSYAGGEPVGVTVHRGTSPLKSGKLQLFLRRREDSEEWPIPTDTIQSVTESEGTSSAEYRATGRFDPRTLGGGRALTPGIWDVYAKVNQTGWSKDVRLGSLRSAAATAGCHPAVLDGVAMVPYWTETYDNLSLDVGASPAKLVRSASAAGEVVDGELRLRLTVAGGPPAAVVALRPAAPGQLADRLPTDRLPATAETDDSTWLVRATLPPLATGSWSVLIGLGAGDDVPLAGVGLTLAAADGRIEIARPAPPAPPARPPTAAVAPPAAPHSLRRRLAATPAGPALRRVRRGLSRWAGRLRAR